MAYIMKKFGLEKELRPISQIHGRAFPVGNLFGGLKIIVLYHPAAALYSTTTRDELKKDFQVLKEYK